MPVQKCFVMDNFFSLAITNPKAGPKEAKTKTFEFDHSYWSHTDVRMFMPLFSYMCIYMCVCEI